jgi:hypothetical protein
MALISLGQLLRSNYFPRVWDPDAATGELRELTSRRTALVGDRTAVRNRIHSTLAMRLIHFDKSGLFTRAGLATLAQFELDPQGRFLIDCDLAVHETLETQIAAVDAELALRGYADARVKLLMTLPGVDVTVAETLIAAFGDISRFRDADHAASYLGLVPKTRASAARCYQGGITKAGNSQARWMLVQAAQSVRRHPGPLGYFFKKLLKRKNHNVAVVATARKLAAIAWHMLTKNEAYRYAISKTTEEKLARLRIRATGVRRVGGTAKGRCRQSARLPKGARRAKPLPEVYAAEGLPVAAPLSPGEQRMVRESGAGEFVNGLAHEQILPSRSATHRASGARARKAALGAGAQEEAGSSDRR